jgi:8-oxo-dGTP pyrophosphatase MutT (NUDIX family)
VSQDTAPVVLAAGGIVHRRTGKGQPRILLVHRPRYDDWSLPKGKAEPGETDEETAVREVEEETGYRCVLGGELPAVHYEDRRGRQKQVRFWHMTVMYEAGTADDQGAPFEPDDEVDERRWISPAAAATLLSYDTDRRTVRSLGGTDALPAAPH